MTTICPTCGSTFIPVQGAQTYCGKPCARMAATLRERQRARAKRPDAQPKTCPTCHTEFTPYRPQQVYCSPPCRTSAGRMTVNGRRSPRYAPGARPVIMPSETKPKRSKTMTDDEFARALRREEHLLVMAGRSLIDLGWRDRRETARQIGQAAIPRVAADSPADERRG